MLVIDDYGTVPEHLLLLTRLLLGLAFFIDSFETASVFILKALEETSDRVYRNWCVLVCACAHRRCTD